MPPSPQGLGTAEGCQQQKGAGELGREMVSAVLLLQPASAVVPVAAAFWPVQWIAYYSLILDLNG